MARKKTTKLEKLAKQLAKTPMTHKQIVKFLLRGTGHKYDSYTRKYYDASLYGTPTRTGLLENVGEKTMDGRWTVNKKSFKPGVPLTTFREEPAFVGYNYNPLIGF